ncbi:hypothetical protein chiPu_0029104, partial [Chiloscyllium punctatum]|nr:hypothetical protein [Chiloscyllium punctatum]
MVTDLSPCVTECESELDDHRSVPVICCQDYPLLPVTGAVERREIRLRS